MEAADLSIYFEPLDREQLVGGEPKVNTIGKVLAIHDENGFPAYTQADLAIIGVKEDRNAVNNKGCAEAPAAVRKHLYNLFASVSAPKIVDFGNINAGHTFEDTNFALSSVVAELIKHNVVPIIIGGGQDLTYANYAAYEKLEQTVNIVSIDPKFDLGELEDELDSESYLSKILLHQPNYLFNYCNIGYQTYFVDPKVLDLMSKLFFDVQRLGELKSNIQECEPLVRNADIVSFDVSAIRAADAIGCGNASPNGLNGEEACQIARYAGMSDKLSSIGFYEYNPELDTTGQTGHLLAQMIWYFIDGFYNRKKDFPIGDKKSYLKYRVALESSDHEIVFYKSDRSDRWWMDVPYPPNKKVRYERHHLVPCSYADYQLACQEEMPDRWWKTFQKLS